MRVGNAAHIALPAEAQGIRCVRQDCISVLAPGPTRPLSETSLTEAKLLAHRGQFAADLLTLSTADGHSCLQPHPRLDQAGVLKARAEVERLAGASGHAAASLRAALQIYEDRRATTLAEQVRAALASLTTQPPLFSADWPLSGPADCLSL